MKAFRSARQSASPVTDGREFGLVLAPWQETAGYVAIAHGMGIEMTTFRKVK